MRLIFILLFSCTLACICLNEIALLSFATNYRAEPRGGKTASVTRGHALLVMRYFGFHGLHTILKRKSSLARERLVDFTGELQVQCKSEKEGKTKAKCPALTKAKCPALGETYILPPWRNQYEVEHTSHGGRANANTPNNLYAQEIAALPLERSTPQSSSRSRGKSSNRSSYDGMLLHRSFCNELVCQPKILDNCAKKHIFIKVEMKELKWDHNLKRDIAIPVAPSIHNTRRGPWLVDSAFSSCAMGTPQFIDEFKVKLPLVLDAPGSGKVGLMFSVYHFNFNVKKRKKNRMMSRQNDAAKPEPGYSIDLIGSGFLPLALENSPTCLIANGDHEVPIRFRAIQLNDLKDTATTSPLEHQKRFSFGESFGGHMRSWSSSSVENNELRMSKSGDTTKGSDTDEIAVPLPAEERYPQGSIALTRLLGHRTSMTDDDTQEDESIHSGSRSSHEIQTAGQSDHITGDLKLPGSQSESSVKDPFDNEMILQVTVTAFTSVHPQNKALAALFLAKPNPPRSLMSADFSEHYAPWGKYRSEILYRLKPERIPPFNFVGGALAETERKLLEPVVSLTKSSKCPHSDLMTHLVRVISQLWRTTVSGAGEPSILWAR